MALTEKAYHLFDKPTTEDRHEMVELIETVQNTAESVGRQRLGQLSEIVYYLKG